MPNALPYTSTLALQLLLFSVTMLCYAVSVALVSGAFCLDFDRPVHRPRRVRSGSLPQAYNVYNMARMPSECGRSVYAFVHFAYPLETHASSTIDEP